MSQRSGRGALLTTIVLFGAVLAIANAWGFALFAESVHNPDFTLAGVGFTEKMTTTWSTMRARYPGFFWFYFTVPVVLFGFTALLVGLRNETPPTTAPTTPETPEADRAVPALQLLAILQQEGRLIDFLEEDIDAYSDEQVGAAARTIHRGCRKALHERMEIARIFAQEDGTALELAPGYNAREVRLTGNVHGDPPFRGTLEHGGWRAANVELPKAVDGDTSIIAPAEVEID